MTDIEKEIPGVDLGVPVKIQAKDSSIVTETINITSSGAYCKTEKPLPLLSKVELTLLIPGHSRKNALDRKIECRGTVVRTHPVLIDGKAQSYDVAIYFDELSQSDSRLISQYIEHRLPKRKAII
jgi:hypothetical protein